jgi:hypothetical protein
MRNVHVARIKMYQISDICQNVLSSEGTQKSANATRKAMDVQRSIEALSCNHFCHENATVPPPHFFVNVEVAVSNINVFSGAMEMEQ